jgi:hypothetical protein
MKMEALPGARFPRGIVAHAGIQVCVPQLESTRGGKLLSLGRNVAKFGAE